MPNTNYLVVMVEIHVTEINVAIIFEWTSHDFSVYLVGRPLKVSYDHKCRQRY